MALKSSREGLRKELVDYLGNLIIDENLKQNIINSVDDVFINNEELTASVNELDGKIINEASARESADTTLQQNINAEATARQEAIVNIENLINNGVLKVDLLWTNANPTNEFVEQDIHLDLSNYNGIIIEALEDANNEFRAVMFFYVLKTSNSVVVSDCTTVNRWRVITFINDSLLKFSLGHSIGASTGINTDNNIIVPYKIYGVK